MSPGNSAHGKPSPDTWCWELAVKIFNTTLTKDPAKIISTSSANTNHLEDSLTNVVKAAKDAKAHADDAQSPFRKRMETLLMIFNQYCTPIDVMIQHQPHVTALVWGAIRCLISVGVKEIEVSEEIGKALVAIVEQIGRWEKYLQVFPDSARVKSTVAALFAQVINYLVRATVHYQQPLALRYIKSGLTPAQGKLQLILSEIERLSGNIEREAFLASEERANVDREQTEAQLAVSLEEVAAQQAFRLESRSVHDRIEGGVEIQGKIVGGVAEIKQAMDAALASSDQQMKDGELRAQVERAREWLRPVMATAPSLAEWEPGTCEWIFVHPVYQQWEDSDYQKPLWIQGIPGCGKSVLANFLSQKAKSKLSLTHFFRSSSDQDSTKASYLASSMLAQLMRNATVTSMPEFMSMIQTALPLFDHFNSCMDCPFTKLWPVLNSIFGHLDDFTLVVDALDECSDIEKSAAVTERLNEVSLLPNAKIIILSRHHVRFEEALQGCFSLTMDDNVVSSDISLFVQRELERTPKIQPLKVEILKKAEEAQGMFLWAKMMMEYIKKAATPNAQLHRLARFPSGLAEVYERFLQEAASALDEDELVRRKEIFFLLVAAARPLTVGEISVALALKTAGTFPDNRDLLLEPENEVLRLCWPLAMVVNETAQLVHMSVKEFLLQDFKRTQTGSVHFSNQQCNGYLARKCLRRLDNDAFSTTGILKPFVEYNLDPKCFVGSPPTPLAELYPLYEYACQAWHSHLISAKATSDLLSQLRHFVESQAFVAWAESLYRMTHVDMGPILDVRASLRSWYVSLPHDLQSKVDIADFFSGPYTSRSASTLPVAADDELLSYFLNERMGTYSNLAAAPADLRYEAFQRASQGYEKIFGSKHPHTLRSLSSFALERLFRDECADVETLCARVSGDQRETLGGDSEDCYRTKQVEGSAAFYQRKFERAKECYKESFDGLQRTHGPIMKDTLKSQMFLGMSVENLGDMDEAIALYEGVWKTWAPIQGYDNPLSMYSQCCLAIAHRKNGDFASAEQQMVDCFSRRQCIFGDQNYMTIDTAINMAVLYRDMSRHEESMAYLELAGTMGVANSGFERISQVEHVKAQLEIFAGERDHARERLKALLHKFQVEDHRWTPELFWVRLTHAENLRALGNKDEASILFDGIVKRTPGSPSAEIWSEVDAPYQMRIAEIALEQVRKNDVTGAEDLLQAHGLEWAKPEDLWIRCGGSGVDTRWV